MRKSERVIIVLNYPPMASTKSRSGFQLANWANKCMDIFLHVFRCMTESHDEWLPWACFRTMDCSSIWIVRVTPNDQRRCGLCSIAVNLNSIRFVLRIAAVESNRRVPKRRSKGHVVIDTSSNKHFPANRMSSNDYYAFRSYVHNRLSWLQLHSKDACIVYSETYFQSTSSQRSHSQIHIFPVSQ